MWSKIPSYVYRIELVNRYFDRFIVSSSMSKKNLKLGTNTPLVNKIEGPVSEDKKGNILIKIHAKPGAKCNAITDMSEEGIGVQINAPPVEGEANLELMRYIAEILTIKKSYLSMEKGSKSRQKTLSIEKGAIDLEQVKQKFKAVIEKK